MGDTITARCITTCTTPQHGYVKADEVRVFPFSDFDVTVHPYLKHFEIVEMFAEATIYEGDSRDEVFPDDAGPPDDEGDAGLPEAQTPAGDVSVSGDFLK